MGTRGKKTGGRDWKPGQSGNPKGRTRLPDDVKAARSLTSLELERLLNEYLHLPVVEMKARAKRPGASVLEFLIGRVLEEGMDKGDTVRLDYILSRLPKVGSLKQKISLDGGENKDGETQPISIELSERIDQLKSQK